MRGPLPTWPANPSPSRSLPPLPPHTAFQAKALALATLAMCGGTGVILAVAQVAGLADVGGSSGGDGAATAVLSPAGAAAAAEEVRAAVRDAARRRIFGEDGDGGRVKRSSGVDV